MQIVPSVIGFFNLVVLKKSINKYYDDYSSYLTYFHMQ